MQTRSPNSNMDASLYHYAKSSNACSWAELVIDREKVTVTVKHGGGDSVVEYCKWGIIKSGDEPN